MDINLDDMEMGGTSIGNLRTSETELDLSGILSESDTMNKIEMSRTQMRPKQENNTRIADANIHYDPNIQRILSQRIAMPMASNSKHPIGKVETIKPIRQEKNDDILDKIKSYFIKIKIDKKELGILLLLFILLNNKIAIEAIYSLILKVPILKTIDSPYPNLIIRAILFIVLIILIKNYL